MELNKIKIGDIFSYEWGYDQTNIEFYQVVAKTKAMIKVRQIKQTRKENGLQMQGITTPIKDDFVENSKVLIKRPYEWKEHICLNMDFGGCWLWNGKPQNYTSYA